MIIFDKEGTTYEVTLNAEFYARPFSQRMLIKILRKLKFDQAKVISVYCSIEWMFVVDGSPEDQSCLLEIRLEKDEPSPQGKNLMVIAILDVLESVEFGGDLCLDGQQSVN